MKIGTENRKQLMILGALGALALLYAIYTFWPDSTPSPASTAAKPVIVDNTVRSRGTNVPGGKAAVRASNAALDPTLHPEGMLLAESLEYSGSGRNIFSMLSAPPPVSALPKPIASARPAPVVQQPIYTGPAAPPPIDLKFFGVATRADGSKQAFFLKGDDVFIAAPGEIVARRFKVVSIGPMSTEVTDLQNNNTQRLPLQMQ